MSKFVGQGGPAASSAIIDQHNNFGVMRLVLAALVIVSHSAELIDGNRSREVLARFGGTMTCGELAVDAFFIISGFLVLQSFDHSQSSIEYLMKRVRRIFPGFVACAVLVTAFSPLVGSGLSSWNGGDYWKAAVRIALLNWPETSGFPNLTFHALNGSAWSIPYEFRCYLLVLVLGFCGIYRRPKSLVALTAALLLIHLVGWPSYIGPFARLVGYPQLFTRMSGLFCIGSCFYLLRSSIVYPWWLVVLAFCALFAGLGTRFAEPVFAVAGGYLIFWIAFAVHCKFISSINRRTDISYGTYLYAWPIAGSLIYFFSIGSPIVLFSLTLPVSLLAGWLSWHFIERPFVRPKKAHIV